MGEPTKDTAAAPPQPIEITAVGHYEIPASWKADGKVELAVLAAKNWHPTSHDFWAVAEVPNKGAKRTLAVEVGTFGGLLGIITQTRQNVSRPNASIARLNIITHAQSGNIALGGTVAANGDCTLPPFDITNALDSEGMDSSAMSWLNTTGKSVRDDARNKFTSNAEIWLIVCNGATAGASMLTARDMSAAFGVAVLAYNHPVHYWPEQDTAGTRITKRCVTSNGPSGTHGDGYSCWVKVPAALAGQHLATQDGVSGRRFKLPPAP
jgi:hypothetical protein